MKTSIIPVDSIQASRKPRTDQAQWISELQGGTAHITLLRLRDVLLRVGICRSQVYSMMENGTFPKPLRITTKCVRWTDLQIQEWITARIAEGGAA